MEVFDLLHCQYFGLLQPNEIRLLRRHPSITAIALSRTPHQHTPHPVEPNQSRSINQPKYMGPWSTDLELRIEVGDECLFFLLKIAHYNESNWRFIFCARFVHESKARLFHL